MAAVITAKGSTFDTNTGTHTVTATPAVGDYVVIVCANSGITGDPTVTDNNSDGLGTYTKQTSANKDTNTDKVFIYTRNANIGSASSTIFSVTGASSTGGGLTVFNVTGVLAAGTAGVRQVGRVENQTTSTPTITMARTVAGTSNPIITAVFNDTNPAAVTKPTGYTTGYSLGFTTPTTGLSVHFINACPTFTNTITWGGSSASNYGVVAIELNACVSSVGTGLWNDTTKWSSGAVPTDQQAVAIASGDTITFNVDQTGWTGVNGLEVNGTLKASRVTTSYLYIKAAMTIFGTGTLDWGVPVADIIPFAVKATITGGAAWSTIGTSGLTATVAGAEPATQYVKLTQTENIGSTVLHVDTNVTGDIWAPGDTVVINNEVRIIAAAGINAGTITITAGLTAAKPTGNYVALVTRNIYFYSSTTILSSFLADKITIAGGYWKGDTSVANNCISPTIYGGTFTGFYGFQGCTKLHVVNCLMFNSYGINSGDGIFIENGLFLYCNINTGGGCLVLYGVFCGGTLSGNILMTGGVIEYAGQWGLYSASGKIYNVIFRNNTNNFTTSPAITFYNCLFTGGNNFYGYGNYSVGMFVESQQHNQTSAYMSWTSGGITASATATPPTGFTRYNVTTLEKASQQGYTQREITVGAGASANITMWLRKHISMAYLPNMQIFNKALTDPFAGGSTIHTFTMTNSIDTWENQTYVCYNSGATDMTIIIRSQGENASGEMWSAVSVAQGTDPYTWASDPYVVANEATAIAYTGIAVNYTAKTVTATANHSITEVYEYCRAYARTLNLVSPLSTVDGVTFTWTSSWVFTITGCNITSSTQKFAVLPTLGTNGLIEQLTGVVRYDGTYTYYYKHVFENVKDLATASNQQYASVAYIDTNGNDRTYNTSYTNTGVTTDANGKAETYVLYKTDSTTYTIYEYVGLYGYIWSIAPVASNGTPLGTAAIYNILYLASDISITLSRTAALAVSGITVNHTTTSINLNNNTISASQDNLKARQASVSAIEGTTKGYMSYYADGWYLFNSGSYYVAKSGWKYSNSGDTQTLYGGILVKNTPGLINDPVNTLTYDFTSSGTYDLTGATIAGTIHLNSSNNSTVSVNINLGVVYVNDNPTYVTVILPPQYQGITFNGLIADSQVYIFETGTQTVIDYIESSSTSFSWQQTWAADIDVDYTIIKEGYLPLRTTGITSSTTIITVPVQQLADRAYQTSSGLSFGTTATVNTGTKVFNVTALTTVQNWYSFMMESWRLQATLKNVYFPIIPNGPNSFTLDVDWEFSGTSIPFLSQDGIRYIDSSGNITAIYTAIFSVGEATGLQVRYQQVEGNAPTNALATGPIDQLIQTYGDSTHGNFDYTDYLVCKIQADGYDESVSDVVLNYGTLEDQLYVIGLNPLLNGLPTGDPSVTGVTITDHGASPVTWNGKDFSITITDSVGGHTGEEIMRWLRYNYEIGGTFEGTDGFNWFDLVRVNGTKYKTVRGTVYGSTGSALKGVRVVQNDGTTPHPDFDLFTSDDGATYAPPLTVTLMVTNIVTGSRIQIYNLDTSTEMYNEVVTGITWSDSVIYTTDVNIRVRIMYADGAGIGYYWWTFSGLITASGFLVNTTQIPNTIYNIINVDGSTVTECSISGTTIKIFVDDPDNSTTAGRIYNWYQWYLSTESGIRDQDGAYITAIDETHFVFNYGMQIVNQDTANPLNILGANITPSTGQATDIFDLSNGASIAVNFNRVEGFAYSIGSGLSPAEHNQLMASETSTEAQSIKDELKKDIDNAAIIGGL